MNATLLRDFFLGAVTAPQLAADIRNAFERSTSDARRLRMDDSKGSSKSVPSILDSPLQSAFLVLLLTLVNCTRTVTVAPLVSMVHVTDSVTAHTGESSVSMTVVATLTNLTTDTLFIHPCVQSAPYPITATLSRKEPEGWKAVLTPICTLSLMHDPPQLPPGQIRTDTLRFVGWTRANTFPSFPAGPVEGVYRVSYSGVYRSWPIGASRQRIANEIGEPVPASLLISNTFRVCCVAEGRRQ